jgi:hypothetical protein
LFDLFVPAIGKAVWADAFEIHMAVADLEMFQVAGCQPIGIDAEIEDLAARLAFEMAVVFNDHVITHLMLIGGDRPDQAGVG